MQCVLQDWVMELGLRHQGALMTAIRGCDTAPKEDPSKLFVRCLRGEVLNSHCGDNAKAQTFMTQLSPAALTEAFNNFRRNCDHYQHHYVMHMIHSIEIIGYYHPHEGTRALWCDFYRKMVDALHLAPEMKWQLDARLDADEDTFGARDHTCDGTPQPCHTVAERAQPGGEGVD